MCRPGAGPLSLPICIFFLFLRFLFVCLHYFWKEKSNVSHVMTDDSSPTTAHNPSNYIGKTNRGDLKISFFSTYFHLKKTMKPYLNHQTPPKSLKKKRNQMNPKIQTKPDLPLLQILEGKTTSNELLLRRWVYWHKDFLYWWSNYGQPITFTLLVVHYLASLSFFFLWFRDCKIN